MITVSKTFILTLSIVLLRSKIYHRQGLIILFCFRYIIPSSTVMFQILQMFFALQGYLQGKYVHELTDKNFKEAASKKMALVSFYTNTCPHCQQFKRTFEKAAQKLHGLHPSIFLAQVILMILYHLFIDREGIKCNTSRDLYQPHWELVMTS